MADEQDYARLVALGCLKSVRSALVDAKDLLASIGDDDRAADLQQALMLVSRVERDLLAEAAGGDE
jgi:hypothetical protein